MKTFYARLMAGDSRAQALRAAQLELLADFRYRHPAYWAPYLLIGTWL
ncbi:MAG: CHAT domain-containing protein [Myxococcota bacterium]|nr:CHAT domain-containing protein [Myxococcota bacterium]